MIFTYSINERYGNWSDMVSRENDCQKLQINQLFCKRICFFGQKSKYLGMTKTFCTPTPLFRYCRPLFHNSNLWFFGLIGCGGGFAFERRLLCSWSLALWRRDLQGISYFIDYSMWQSDVVHKVSVGLTISWSIIHFYELTVLLTYRLIEHCIEQMSYMMRWQ